ncbi:hypothetical protein KC678_02765, partial [Candidatus Dojkabacteria bacterium]|nr:hypothetical protein [Candidatus Dojkabacteria bacterium]
LVSTENIIKVAFLSIDTYVIATDAGNIYKTINNGKRWKRIHKDKYVEQWVWFDHYVGYISYLDNTGNLVIGQTINGGYSYTKLGDSLSRNMHVLEMRISPKNPNYIVISGRIILLTPTNDELLLPTANSNQTDKGFVIIGR